MTRNLFLFAGVAGLALASPVYAERGGNRAERAQAGDSGEAPKAQRAQRAERVERAEPQQAQRADRPQRIERQRIERAERSPRMERPRFERQEMQRADRLQRIERQRIERADRPQRIERQRIERAERLERRRIQQADRPQRIERQRIERAERPERLERQRIQRAERPLRIERQRIERAERTQRMEQRIERQRIVQAERQALRAERKRGERVDRQALRDERRELRARLATEAPQRFAPRFIERSVRPMRMTDDRRIVDVGERIDPARFSSFVPTIYRARYYDTPDYYYRYDDDLGYLYRVDRDDHFVRALIPLFGGYGTGDPWPQMYYSSYVPLGYRNYYYDTPDYYYRYDGYGIYRVDATTQLITALVALLTGQGFGVGQMLPASYGVYNVPMAYRSTYYDRDDAWYRYGDGFIYQVDPYTRRIADRYPIYGAGYDYMIGEPWPVAYPGYNVPYGYQSLYYDTPQHHYRYANGGIYQVDPTTQVIMALVALVTGQQLTVGQPLPAAYSAYNVPFDYRDRYVDDDDDWYRYADGFIYRVDPRNGLIEEAIPVYA